MKKRTIKRVLTMMLASALVITAMPVNAKAETVTEIAAEMEGEEVAPISLNKDIVVLDETKTTKDSVYVTDESATADKSFTVESSDDNIVKVTKTADDEIRVTAVNYGSATVTVTSADGKTKAECVVNVKCTDMTLDDMVLVLDEKKEITPAFKTGFSYPLNKVYYSSSDENVATISEGNKITGKKAGTATITATIVKSNNFGQELEKTFKVTVNSPVKEIITESDEIDLIVGAKAQIKPTIVPTDATDKTLQYVSDDELIAKVDQDGNVTAIATGATNITVKAKDGSGTKKVIKVTVTKPVNLIDIEKDSFQTYKGMSIKLPAPTVLPADATEKGVIYSSSDEKIATVDAEGNITTVNAGKCIISIRAKDGSKAERRVSLTVLGQIEKITADKTEISVEEGQEGSFVFNTTVSANDIYTELLDVKNVNSVQISDVKIEKNSDAENNTKMTFKAVKAGTTTVDIVSKNPTEKDVTLHVTITVTEKKEEPKKEEITSAKGLDNVTYEISGTEAAVTDTAGAEGSITILSKVKIGDKEYKVTKIGSKAFKGNKKITKISMPSTVKEIGSEAFNGCTKLSAVTIGKNVTTIGSKAFYGCKKIKKITITSKVTKIGSKAFYNCSALKTVTVKSTKLTSVGSKAFTNLPSKSTIKVPKSKVTKYKKLLKSKYSTKKTTVKA